MKLQRVVLVLLGMMLLFAGRSSAAAVKTDYDRNANFTQYKTYSWERVQTRDPLMVDRIKSAVNGSLAAKGLTEVPTGGDLSIVAIEVTHNQQTLDTFYNNFGGGGDSADLVTPPQLQRRTGWEPLSSTCRISPQKNSSGAARPATRFPISPKRTSITSTRAW